MEAIAATLYITGFIKEAKHYLDQFSWGHSFIELNEELLDIYSNCTDSKSIVEAEAKYLEEAEKEQPQSKPGIIKYSNIYDF